MIVLADADVEKAAGAAAFGKFMHAGQICMAINQEESRLQVNGHSSGLSSGR